MNNTLRATVLAAALALAAGAATAAVPGSAIISGLTWRSGAKQGACLVPLRQGRALDVNHVHVAPADYATMVRNTAGWVRRESVKAPMLVVSLALTPRDNARQFAECAAGAFDTSWRAIGANLAGNAAQQTVVRLGWEANTSATTHPWSLADATQIESYKACWRHAAEQLKVGGPGLLLDWTSAKKGLYDVRTMYPGDDVVDVIGVHHYDGNPRLDTQEAWDAAYLKTWKGGPWGLGAWLQFAKDHGKLLSVGEWGVWARPPMDPALADDTVYMANMEVFFAANAPAIAYDSLQNTTSEHRLCPDTPFPKAAAEYGLRWGLGE